MNKQYKEYLCSAQWATIKIELYESRGKKCERCGSENRLQIHHKTYKNIFHEEPQDLEILCDGCHRAIHNIKKSPKPKIKKRKGKSKAYKQWISTAKRQIKESAKRRGFYVPKTYKYTEPREVPKELINTIISTPRHKATKMFSITPRCYEILKLRKLRLKKSSLPPKHFNN